MTVLAGGDSRIATGFGTGSEFVALIKTDGTEVSGGGYARQSATFEQDSQDPDVIHNAAACDFGSATADWGTVNKVRIYSTSTGTSASNQIFEATISSRTINSGDSFSIPAEGFEITIV